MRTTIDIPDVLFREIKAKASQRGEALKTFMLRAAKAELERGDSAEDEYRAQVPLVQSTVGSYNINPERIAALQRRTTLKSLPDINVWLALTFSGHEHHAEAAAWFAETLRDSCAFCRMTQQGYLRIASNPKVFGADALTLPKAWACYDDLLRDSRVGFATEAPGVEQEWRALTADATFSRKIWNDAYLAALAKMNALEIVTFDQGFKRYPGLKLKLLGKS
jgi:toxin-antitoxin system PIN domain toxin